MDYSHTQFRGLYYRFIISTCHQYLVVLSSYLIGTSCVKIYVCLCNQDLLTRPISDGDSKAHAMMLAEQTYRVSDDINVQVKKLDCVGHVQKDQSQY